MSGERAALEIALSDDDDEEQLGLFGEPLTEAGLRRAPERRGPGRPAGSRNKRTERTIVRLLARHKDPREVLLEIAEANVYDLAALLQCSLFEAAQEKRLAAIGVLPYVAQKQPLAVDVTNRQVVHLTINEGAVTVGEDGGVGFTARVIENVQYQEVSDDPSSRVGQSGVGQSEATPCEDKENATSGS